MIVKYAILRAILLIITAFVIWAFMPARHLPATVPASCGSGCTR